MGVEKYRHHSIIKDEDGDYIVWNRGKEFFYFMVPESLAEKSRKSDKDALEVMFYLENKRLPKEKELENYNKTDVKRYVGDNFVIYEENGKYEIGIEKEDGGAVLGEVYYPITKELKEKAFRSTKDAYEVMRYAETGRWPTNNQDETDRDFIREFPELVLKNPERCKKLFSKEEYEHLVTLAKELQEKEKAEEREKEEIRENPELILWVSEEKRNMFSEEEINRLEVLAKEKIKVRKKKTRKRCGIFIVIITILIGSFYSYYKVNNRNAFEEMYNSYFNVLPLSAIDNMSQIEYKRRDKRGYELINLDYKEKVNGSNVGLFLVKFNDKKSISISSSTLIDEGVYLGIYYKYNMDNRKLENGVGFYGENVPTVEDKTKQTRELLGKYNISKEYLQEKSEELLNTVLTDWKRFSNSSYSKDNMGKLTIEKNELLR